MRFTSILKHIMPYRKKRNSEQVKALAARGRFAYSIMPLGAFDSMKKLRNTIRAEAGDISIPVLIMQGSRDEVVWPRSGKHLAEMIPGASLISLESSEHIATMGEEIPLIARAIKEFAK